MHSINEIWQNIKSIQYNIKAEQVEPPCSTYTCKVYTTYVLICLNIHMFSQKKMQANFIEWNHTPLYLIYIYRPINKYDTFLKFAAFVVLLKKLYSISGWPKCNLCF